MLSNQKVSLGPAHPDNISAYIKDLKKHLKELSNREQEVVSQKLRESEAEKQNINSLLAFHENLTKFLKQFNIRI